MTIKSKAYARAGLLGNPSDGYFGKIIAISVKNFFATVTLEEEKDKLRIESPEQDLNIYNDIHELVERITRYGYYGGVRLVKAGIKKFYEYCKKKNLHLEEKNFTIRYDSTIPRQLGLGGSSAIILAALRCSMKFYGIDIPQEILPTIVLDAEREELGINAGFMDRVIQVYEGCVYMDLDARFIEEKGHGIYEKLDPELLPDIYIAFKPDLGKVSGRVLNDIQVGYEKGDPFVLDTLKGLAEIAETGKKALLEKDVDKFFALMDENFELRSRIMRISHQNMELIETGRACGASAKFAGSGGSIIGIYRGEEMYERLVDEFEKINAKVFKPVIE
jgi:glucuronokinase